MADDRTYIRVHDGLDEHPKVEPLSDAAFRLLMRSWFYCSRNRTDGRIADVIWKRRGTPKARRELIDAGLADQRDGFVEMHDYLEHQRSAEEIRLLKESRGDTGTFGNHVRWHVVKRKPKKDCEHCQKDAETIANGSQKGSQGDRKPIASTEAEAEAEEKNSSKGGSHVSSEPANYAPPLYPDHCPDHQEPVPPKCGGCGKQKALNKAAGRHLAAVVDDAVFGRPAWCGRCDEFTRLADVVIDGHDAVRQCPACHPLAKESA